MRSILVFLFTIIAVLSSYSQELPSDFFDKNGNVAVETKELNARADTIAVIKHRRDDIVWSKIVYRIIDLRDMQNRPLYNPVMPNGEYKNLFRIILESMVYNDLKAYRILKTNNLKTYLPDFSSPVYKNTPEFYNLFKYPSIERGAVIEEDSVILYENNRDSINDEGYRKYAPRQYKFLIKEIVFFNKHYSKMYTKVIALAPLYTFTSLNLKTYHLNKEPLEWAYFVQSIPCWFLYEELRPYLTKYYIKDSNKTLRMTFDDFFQMKLYSSYILGDDNTTDKMLLEMFNDPVRIKYEQDRIEREILNVEQDVWEY